MHCALFRMTDAIGQWNHQEWRKSILMLTLRSQLTAPKTREKASSMQEVNQPTNPLAYTPLDLLKARVVGYMPGLNPKQFVALLERPYSRKSKRTLDTVHISRRLYWIQELGHSRSDYFLRGRSTTPQL